MTTRPHKIFHDCERNGKVIRNPYPGPDHHQMLVPSKRSPSSHAYHVWSTSVNAFVSYPAHPTDRMTKRMATLLRQPSYSYRILSSWRSCATGVVVCGDGSTTLRRLSVLLADQTATTSCTRGRHLATDPTTTSFRRAARSPCHKCCSLKRAHTTAASSVSLSPAERFNGPLKPQSNGPLYSNTVIGALAVDGWAVTFGTARRGLAVPNVTAHPSTTSVPTSYYSTWHYNYLCTLTG